MSATAREYQEWASDKQARLGVLAVELDEATETYLQLVVNGTSKLQILIPSTYHSAVRDSSEVFLVVTVDDVSGKVESAMLGLNDRLEHVRVTENALSKVLDLLLAALEKLHERRGSRRKRDRFGQDEIETGSEPEEDEGSDGADSEDEYQSDVDASCYDIAVGKSGASCATEFDTRTRGYLHAVAEDARKICENIQRSAFRDMDNPLMWVRIGSKPVLLAVQLQFELAGMIDERIAAGLGLSLNEPVFLTLEFSEDEWSKSIFQSKKVPKFACVAASQGILMSSFDPEKSSDDIDRFLESTGDRHRSYGLEVLLPELTKKFFANLNQETPGDAVDLEGFEHAKVTPNPFICLALFISLQLRLLPGWCLVCWKKLPFSVTRMRTCDNDLCLYRFEELGLAVSLLDEVKSNPALVDVDLSLALAAAESPRDVFEPFPGFLLANQEMRGRSGWFGIDQAKTTAPANRLNKRIEILKDVLLSIPSIQTLNQCASERSLKKALTRMWYEYKYQGAEYAPHGGYVGQGETQIRSLGLKPRCVLLEKQDPEVWRKEANLAYDVTRFILMTNRLSLSLMSAEDEVLKPKMFTDKFDYGLLAEEPDEFTHYQFVVLHDAPEKEAHFTARRQKHGSFFAFHGSPVENWYSILRNGLRSMSSTRFMSAGAAYGEGIYMASDLAISMGYAKAAGWSWSYGKLKNGFQCIAICEVINGSPRENLRSSTIFVVPRENERDVAIRYFLVLKPHSSVVPRHVHIKGRALMRDPPLDLLTHYQRLQESQAEAQQSQRKDRMSARSAVFHRALAADETHLSSKPAAITQPPTVTASSGKGKAPARQDVHHYKRQRPLASLGTLAVMQELSNLMRSIKKSPSLVSSFEKGESAPVLSGTIATIPDEDNLSLWRISLHPYLFKESTNLYNDFEALRRLRNAPADVLVELEVQFPAAFPFEPPFVRVLSPRFKMHTGHVTVGGSICMELLTASGWSPACSFESLLVQVVMAFVEGEGRLDLKAAVSGKNEYQESEAREAFQRAARAHGWKTT